MYTESAQTAGHHRFLQRSHAAAAACPCQHRVHYGEPGYRPASAGQTDHPSPDCRRDVQARWVQSAGGRGFLVEGVGHRSPQRRPVFAAPGPYGHFCDLSQVCSWDLDPAQWSYALESGLRQYPSVREQCGCVAHAVLKPGTPHPLPHLQVKGQRGCRNRKTVRYVSVEEEAEDCESCRVEPRGARAGRLTTPNGHCGPAFFEGREEREDHQDWVKEQGGSEEGQNGRSGPHKGFFPTEVPQRHLNQSRRKFPIVPSSGVAAAEAPKATAYNDQRRRRGPEGVKPRRKQESVKDQIRQVVTDLEDVLGGLKQVHVEMKEVVEQIDRLTANIDLSEEAPCGTPPALNNADSPAPSGDTVAAAAVLAAHKPVPIRAPQHVEEDRIILRTNSPSPVHMASVVKTSRFTPPGLANQERPSINGHPPHLHPHTGQTHPDPHPQSLDPKVIIGNCTSGSGNQKPPLYPQNGRCGQGPYLAPKPARTPAYPGRGRQSTSMV